MQELRKLRKFFLVLGLAIASPHVIFAAQENAPLPRTCLADLHPAAEIYVSGNQQSRVLPSPLRNSESRARGEILWDSPRRDTYIAILHNIRDPKLYQLTEDVLAQLETIHQQREILNYSAWLNFLQKSQESDLQHRIFEGLHAGFLLSSYDARLSFEPKDGFFANRPTGPRKSMDIELRDPETGTLLAYKEVKRVGSYKNVTSALGSALGKAEEIRPLVGDEVELSVAIYVDGHKLETDEDRFWESANLHDRAEAVVGQLGRSANVLDSVVLIDLQLGYFMKVYVYPDGNYVTSEGVYPLPPTLAIPGTLH